MPARSSHLTALPMTSRDEGPGSSPCKPEKGAHLALVAAHRGLDPELAQQVLSRYLEDDRQLRRGGQCRRGL